MKATSQRITLMTHPPRPLALISFKPSALLAAIFALGFLSPAYAQRSWSRINVPATESLLSIAFASNEVGIILGDSSTVLRTVDGGASWNRIHVPGLDRTGGWQRVAFASATVGVISAGHDSDGGMYRLARTTDAGASWTQLAVDSVFRNTRVNEMTFISPSTVIAVGRDRGIIRSTDTGSSWTEVYDKTFMAMHTTVFRDGGIGLAAGAYPGSTANGYMVRTLDSGKTWQSIETGRNNCMRGPLLFREGRWTIFGCDEILESFDDGSTWSVVATEPHLPYCIYDAIATRSGEIFAVGEWPGAIFTSADGGSTWRSDSVGEVGFLRRLASADGSRIFAVGGRGVVMMLDPTSAYLPYQRSVASAPSVVADGNRLLIFCDAAARDRSLSVSLVNGVDVIRTRIERGSITSTLDVSRLSGGVYFVRLEGHRPTAFAIP